MTDIRRPKQHESMFTDMAGPKSEKKVFLSYKDMLVFAACLGYSHDKRIPFEGSLEPVGMHIFKGEYDEAIFNCIGLAETEDPTIMGEKCDSERVRIFEEYACGGLDIIKNRVYESPEDWDEALVALISEQYSTEKSILDDITNLVD